MWCLTCGREMQRVQVERDDGMFVTGYEHHTWQCSACGQSERRLVFVRAEPAASVSSAPAAPDPREPAASGSSDPAASGPGEPAASGPGESADPKPKLGSWERAVGKLRDRQRLLAEEAAAEGQI
jgi:hypothetical protein